MQHNARALDVMSIFQAGRRTKSKRSASNKELFQKSHPTNVTYISLARTVSNVYF